MSTLIWVLVSALSVSFLCSILEAVLLSVTYSHVALMREEGGRAGRYLHAMQERIDEPIAAILTLNTIAHTLGATMGGALALQVFGNQWIGLFSAGLTLTILLFSEIVPKTLGATHWKRLAGPSAIVLQGMIWGMKPVLIPLGWFNRLITPNSARPSGVSRQELEVLAEMGHRAGTIDEDELRVVTNVIRLDEVSVAEVMTPRTDMIGVPSDATVDEAINTMLDEGHLRLPVYRNSLDHIEGILLARDLWRAKRDGVLNISEVLHPVAFFPTSKSVEDLLPEMRGHRRKMAIVVDEFGGTAGLVTLEDLIEEIVGEIQDEHEGDEPQGFTPLPGGGVQIWGGTTVRDTNDHLDLELPEEPHDTVGGFVFGSLDRIGQVGDEVPVGPGSLRITHMKGRRVEYVVYTAGE